MDIENIVCGLNDKVRTPFYLYDEKIILENINRLKDVFCKNNFGVLYAMKANSNPYILKLVKNAEMGVDACSVEEVKIAFICGFSPENIYYNADCLNSDEIDFAVERNVNLVIGSLDALYYLMKRHSGHELSLRLNSGVGAGHSSKVITNGELSKFGINFADIPEAIRSCKNGGLKIVGIHSHTGSGEMGIASYVENANVMLDISLQFDSLRFINFGGGFGYDYKDHQEYDIDSLSKKIRQLSSVRGAENNIKLIVEPGRYLVANTAILVSKVCSVKESSSRNFLGLDTGHNHFPRCFYYDAWHDIENVSTLSNEMVSYDITGYLCQSGDIFARQRLLPKTKVGDLICIKDVGAYGYSMSSNFNSRVRPGEYLVDTEDNFSMIRRPECFEDIISTFNLD
ncbi:diaminopimelate decarboxylase [Serratia plymuthica]|uniref:diaminopimelate decarboxylase n=1 Tax=Serratia plymuthica TaxID=82996 RepID=UPI001BAF1A62|nr:diaminopimelate decarboxylase [Serratia plymuthica]QUY46443.1 diaminopimelate decarboxylase [Serratia plymuthica]